MARSGAPTPQPRKQRISGTNKTPPYQQRDQNKSLNGRMDLEKLKTLESSSPFPYLRQQSTTLPTIDQKKGGIDQGLLKP